MQRLLPEGIIHANSHVVDEVYERLLTQFKQFMRQWKSRDGNFRSPLTRTESILLNPSTLPTSESMAARSQPVKRKSIGYNAPSIRVGLASSETGSRFQVVTVIFLRWSSTAEFAIDGARLLPILHAFEGFIQE